VLFVLSWSGVLVVWDGGPPWLALVGKGGLAAFFLLVNASMLVAWGYHLSGRRTVTWTPTAR